MKNVLIYLFILTILPLHNAFAFDAANLNIECRSSNPKQHEVGNALRMHGMMHKALRLKYEERLAQGKRFDVAIVARAGLNMDKNKLLTSEYDAETLVEKAKHDKGSTKKALVSNYLSKDQDKMSYTHVGIFVRVPKEADEISSEEDLERNAQFDIPNVDYSWRAIHLLSPCGKAVSRIYNERLGSFFLDDLSQYKAWVMVPSDDIQEKIIDAINDTTLPDEKNKTIHWSLKPPVYNVAATLKEFSPQDYKKGKNSVLPNEEGNSNFWPVYLLTSAISNGHVTDYKTAYSKTIEYGYEPSNVILGGFLYSLALKLPDALKPKTVRIRKKQHPYKKYKLLELTTAVSIKKYMETNHILEEEFEVVLPKQFTIPKKLLSRNQLERREEAKDRKNCKKLYRSQKDQRACEKKAAADRKNS